MAFIITPPDLPGFVIMFHRDNHTSPLVPLVDIPVGLGHLFQRVASINDRLYLARRNQLREEEQGGACPKRNGGGFLIGQIGWFRCQRRPFGQTYVLGMGTKTAAGYAKNLVAFLKPCYIFKEQG
jgi:hypothetical protein